MNPFRTCVLALGVWAACGPDAAAAPPVLYDNFQASALDPARWLDAERSRVIGTDNLRLAQRDWGSTSSDAGSIGRSWSEVLARGGPVTQLRATVKVTAVNATGCPASATPTSVRARVNGTFFNTGNRAAGSNVGDVYAQMQAIRVSNSADAPGVLRVQGNVLVCTASDCNTATQIGSTVDLGTVNIGTNVTLQVEWDRANKKFVFVRDKGAQTGSVSYDGYDDSTDPGNVFKTAGVRTDVANCASGPRTQGFIDARFDNVQVNVAAKP